MTNSFVSALRAQISNGLIILLTVNGLLSLEVMAAKRIQNTCASNLAGAETSRGHTSDESWAPPKSVSEILRSMNTAKYRSSIHPDKVLAPDVEKLPVGTVVFLDTSRLGIFKLTSATPQSIRFEVRGSGLNRLELYNAQYGLLEFDKNSIQDLWGNLYRTRNFRLRSIFMPGEFVQLGWPGFNRPNEDLHLVDLRSRETVAIDKNSLPWIAKFIRVLNPNEYEVEFPSINGVEAVRFKVSENQIFQLNIGSGKTLRAVLNTLENIAPSFSPGEIVRYRDANGLMQSGRMIGTQHDGFLLRHLDAELLLPPSRVFKVWAAGSPASVRINVAGYWLENASRIDLESPTGLLKEVLDGAARFSSHPSFLSAPFVDQLKMLTTFQNVFLPWKRSGATVEATGLLSFSEILCSGAGVCRHNTPLMAAILSEAGLTVRIFYREMTETEFRDIGPEFRGHTWLEVDSPDGQTFVVDPSSEIVKPMESVHEHALSDPKSSDASWWGHLHRRQLDLFKFN